MSKKGQKYGWRVFASELSLPRRSPEAIEKEVRHVVREIMVAVMLTGKSLTVPGVGTFYRRTRKARRVTLNGVESVIPEMNEIGFRLSKSFDAERLDGITCNCTLTEVQK